MISPLRIASSEGQARIAALLSRFQEGDDSPLAAVAEILAAVRKRGDDALLEYCRAFDAPNMTVAGLTARPAEIEAAYQQVDDDFRATLALAIRRITDFHQREIEDSWIQTRADGVVVGRLVRPVDSAGLYVPGGKGGSTPLVSSVLMNGIPALIAGVPRLVMVTPPDAGGGISPHLLVAAGEIGIKEIYKLGSAWAIAALAYGSETVPAVDVIVGPGNQFVAEAKRQVSGRVRIDMIAGPSEVLIIADESAKCPHVAADMLAQAEHDPQALAVVITTDKNLASALSDEVRRQLAHLSRRDIAEKSLADRGCVLIADNIEEAINLANQIAIEHLELMLADPWLWLPKIRHAGAIFLGGHTPEAAGDYLAGPNHVLPTMGTARFASALGVDTFVKKSSIISYSREALMNDAVHIQRLAGLEGLTGHANSVAVRS
ncbi:MAG: histidinol dehydrogenase [Desulfobulbaceae bacterium]|jgi:histidinol dehydrogenase|nr:histidinol dehydrogenase [Desulfobulbaceae bacterium]